MVGCTYFNSDGRSTYARVHLSRERSNSFGEDHVSAPVQKPHGLGVASDGHFCLGRTCADLGDFDSHTFHKGAFDSGCETVLITRGVHTR